jgi:hypothetical protein
MNRPKNAFKDIKKLHGSQSASELYRPRQKKLVPVNVSREYCLVSATGPYGRYFQFCRPEPLLSLQISSTVILLSLSGLRSRHSTEDLVAPGIEPGISGSVLRNKEQKTYSVAFSPHANFTDWSTATCLRNSVPNLRIEGCRVVSTADALRSLISVFQTGAATFLSSSSSLILTRLSGLSSRPTATQDIWFRQESNSGTLS